MSFALTSLAPSGELTRKEVANLLTSMHECDLGSPVAMGAVVELDLSKITWVEPIGLCILASWLRSRRSCGGVVRVVKRPVAASMWDPDLYLETVGFYDFCAADGSSEDVGRGGTRYMWRTVGDERQVISCVTGILSLIRHNIPIEPQAQSALSISFSEVLENVFHHAGCGWCAVGVQVYPRKGRLSFAVSDFGCGIRESLMRNKNIVVPRSDSSAIQLALERGVTSRPESNSGMALCTIRALVAQNEGKMSIVSGRGDWDSDEGKTDHSGFFLQGTALLLDFNTNSPLDMAKVYEEYGSSGDDDLWFLSEEGR